MNRSEKESNNTRSVMQLMMPSKGAHSQGTLFESVLTGHTVDFATHTSPICIKYQVLLAAYYKPVKANTFMLSTCFLFLFLDMYYIIFYAISLSFFIHSVFFRPRQLPSLPSG
jgi:hypothetical protein